MHFAYQIYYFSDFLHTKKPHIRWFVHAAFRNQNISGSLRFGAISGGKKMLVVCITKMLPFDATTSVRGILYCFFFIIR